VRRRVCARARRSRGRGGKRPVPAAAAMLEDGGHSGFGQGRGGNEGMSGTPMWQIKRKLAEYEKQRENLVQELIAEHEDRAIPPEPPNVLVDAVSAIGGSADGKAKPLVRHVLVKDLNKVAAMKSLEFPKTELFADKAPLGLYAVFDGNSCSGSPGPAAAEYCARNFHLKVMDNLVMLRQGAANAAFLKAALIKSFHDLDADYLATKPQVEDGCGAAAALLLGNHVFIAKLGQCGAWLAEAEGDRVAPMALGSQATTSVGSLGEPARKAQGSTTACTPEVHSVALKGCESHPFLLLASSTLIRVMSGVELVEAAADFHMQPRIACGDIVAAAVEKVKSQPVPSQLLLAQVCFLPPKEKAQDKKEKKAEAPPAAKKPKAGSKEGMRSIRLRHILLRTQDATAPVKNSSAASSASSAKAKPVRPRQEAEVLLRQFLKELKDALKGAARAPRTANDLVLFDNKKFGELCRQYSHCPTAQKGGGMCGDLGWMSLEDLAQLGGNLREKVEPLKPGQWSDICSSDQGVHLVQRVA